MPQRAGVRLLARHAKTYRCTTLVCVLENPSNPANVAAVMRNVDALGVGKLYIVTDRGRTSDAIRNDSSLNNLSASASRRVYTQCFATTASCLEYLARKRYRNVVTSPHIKGKTNAFVDDYQFTAPHVAVWFGNETDGISDEAVAAADACVQLEMRGFVESMNLACSTAIVLNAAVNQRHARGRERVGRKGLPPVPRAVRPPNANHGTNFK